MTSFLVFDLKKILELKIGMFWVHGPITQSNFNFFSHENMSHKVASKTFMELGPLQPQMEVEVIFYSEFSKF